MFLNVCLTSLFIALKRKGFSVEGRIPSQAAAVTNSNESVAPANVSLNTQPFPTVNPQNDVAHSGPYPESLKSIILLRASSDWSLSRQYAAKLGRTGSNQ
ncbi:hypothetical protein RvY_16259 [Ramazzottius varieornatus]|uniref:Uncharacterized protein n=1 Tax=Ramazzottius varieornatus TaxID=947166 RepID=A0A1D1W2B0_RAMVA|nr:hypothetical protein RvY_16259 [Ramazzottius varieornatus]